MKKALFIIIAWFCVTSINAQQDSIIFRQIEEAGKSIQSMECHLRNTMTRPYEQVEKEGNIKYLAANQIAANFDGGEYVLMSGNKMKIKLGIFNNTFRTDRNPLIKPISRMLVNAISGQCRTIAEENNYNISLTEDTQSYLVTLTTKKKKLLGIGYKQAVFEYRKDNMRLKSILLIDYKDNHDLYSFEEQVFDQPIDENAFKL